MGNWIVTTLKSRLGKTLNPKEAVPNTRQEGGRYALLIFSMINLLNFADRFVPASVKTLIEEDLHLSDLQSTYPTTGMIIVYMICSMTFGILADKNLIDRRIVVAIAISIWSLATALSGLATDLTSLVILRSIVGIGEAAYVTIAPPMLTDFYPHFERNTMFGVYNLCIPVGAALGFGIGGVLGGSFGWRVAFFVVGFPGILASMTALQVNEPVQGINDLDVDGALLPNDNESISPIQRRNLAVALALEANSDSNDLSHERSPSLKGSPNRPGLPNATSFNNSPTRKSQTEGNMSLKQQLIELWNECVQIMTNPYFFFCLGGLCANNFAIGGLAEWVPTFLYRYDNFSLSGAGLLTGAITVVGGICGTLLGSKTVDYAEKYVKGAYFLIPALYTIPGATLLLIVINLENPNQGLIVVLIFIAEICLWTFLAPLQVISISCLPSHLRARSCGITILFLHLLGDVIAAPIIGAISTQTGSLRTGLQASWIAAFVSGIWWFLGYYLLPTFRPPTEAELEKKKVTYYEVLFKDPPPSEANHENAGITLELRSLVNPSETNSLTANDNAQEEAGEKHL